MGLSEMQMEVSEQEASEQKEDHNLLPERCEGTGRCAGTEGGRRTEFDSEEEKLAYDANGLINVAKGKYEKPIVTVQEALDLTSRTDDSSEYLGKLRKEIARQIKNPELGRLMALVVEPINALSEKDRTVNGKVRSGEEIARAIPDVKAFLAEVDLQKEDGILLEFFELNESGQLVMKDDCKEAYGLGENGLQARIRQTRIVYKKGGQTKVMTGEECFDVTAKRGGRPFLMELSEAGRPLRMELSEAVKKIDSKSILMVRGLPHLKWDSAEEQYTGEYARMNAGQLERETITWAEDETLVNDNGSPDFSQIRIAYWNDNVGFVSSSLGRSIDRADDIGSRGVLRVNLNFEF